MKRGKSRVGFVLLLCCPMWAAAQGTFLEKNLYTQWTSGEEALSFLQAAAKNSHYGGAEHPTTFEFQGVTYAPQEDGLQWAALRRLECCMCGHTALVKNDPDTLRLERGSRGDFGPISVTTHTFFLEGEDLVQMVSERTEGEAETESRRLWELAPSRVLPAEDRSENVRYSNCWVPLNVRAEPVLGSEVLGQLQWGEPVAVLGQSPDSLSVDLNFGATFKAESTALELSTYALRSSFVKVEFDGGVGHVFGGLLSADLPFDFSSFFVAPAPPTAPPPSGRFQRADAELLWQERLEVEAREEGMATKTFSGYSDGVVVKRWYDGKYQQGLTIEIPVGSPDQFYVMTNNLLRFLSPLGFDTLSLQPSRCFVSFSPMSESFTTELSPDGTKMYIHYEGGGC